MPLNGSGALIGAAILTAIGNPDPAAIPAFMGMADTIGQWCLSHVSCTPGSMVSAGTVVSGRGGIDADSDGADLGPLLAVAMNDPSENGIAKWTVMAKALVAHMKTFGQVDPTTFVAPSPGPGPLTATGTVAFTSLAFVPPLSTQLEVSDPVAAAMLEVFGAQILMGIQLNAQVSPVALVAPFVPYTSPSGGGSITGFGSIL